MPWRTCSLGKEDGVGQKNPEQMLAFKSVRRGKKNAKQTFAVDPSIVPSAFYGRITAYILRSTLVNNRQEQSKR